MRADPRIRLREDLQRYRQLNARFEKLLQALAKGDQTPDSQQTRRMRIFDFKAEMNAIEARWPEISASEWEANLAWRRSGAA